MCEKCGVIRANKVTWEDGVLSIASRGGSEAAQTASFPTPPAVSVSQLKASPVEKSLPDLLCRFFSSLGECYPRYSPTSICYKDFYQFAFSSFSRLCSLYWTQLPASVSFAVCAALKKLQQNYLTLTLSFESWQWQYSSYTWQDERSSVFLWNPWLL